MALVVYVRSNILEVLLCLGVRQLNFYRAFQNDVEFVTKLPYSHYFLFGSQNAKLHPLKQIDDCGKGQLSLLEKCDLFDVGRKQSQSFLFSVFWLLAQLVGQNLQNS